MSDWVFAATGVHPPAVAPEELDKLNERWHTLTTKVKESTTTTGKIISDITTHNTGEAADAFTSCMNASGIPTRLTTFQQHTNTIEQAHTTASCILHDTTTQMQEKAAELNTNLRRALTTPNLQTPITLFTLLKKAQQDLHTIDTTNAQAITNAYSNLRQESSDSSALISPAKKKDPDSINPDPDHYEDVDAQVAASWKFELTDAERRRAAQVIVNELCEKYGIDPKKITWTTELGGEVAAFNGEIKINPETLSDPFTLNVIAHETRHYAQRVAMVNQQNPWNPWTWLSSVNENMGVTDEEVDSWIENKKHYIQPGDDYQAYLNQPVEVDARKAGNNFSTHITLEDLKHYSGNPGLGTRIVVT